MNKKMRKELEAISAKLTELAVSLWDSNQVDIEIRLWGMARTIDIMLDPPEEPLTDKPVELFHE